MKNLIMELLIGMLFLTMCGQNTHPFRHMDRVGPACTTCNLTPFVSMVLCSSSISYCLQNEAGLYRSSVYICGVLL